MRRLVPEAADEPLDDLYLDLELAVPAPPGRAGGPPRPLLYLGMVASVDGAATLGGTTAGLGGEADALAFSRLRETCDAILVGAGTVRVEDYGPPRTRPGGAERRRARGLAPVPTIVVVTASADLDPAARLFSDPARPALVVTTDDAPAERVDRLAPVAEVIRAGRGRVDLAAAVDLFAARGWLRVLCEGGPRLNASLLAAGLVDELFLTVTPGIVGGAAPRIVDGDAGPPRTLELVELREHGGELLLRYRVVG